MTTFNAFFVKPAIYMYIICYSMFSMDHEALTTCVLPFSRYTCKHFCNISVTLILTLISKLRAPRQLLFILYPTNNAQWCITRSAWTLLSTVQWYLINTTEKNLSTNILCIRQMCSLPLHVFNTVKGQSKRHCGHCVPLY